MSITQKEFNEIKVGDVVVLNNVCGTQTVIVTKIDKVNNRIQSENFWAWYTVNDIAAVIPTIHYDTSASGLVGCVCDNTATLKAYAEINHTLNITIIGKIKKVIFNAPATIILWNDGTKTVVKCDSQDEYNKESGLMLCILKKILGSTETGKILDFANFVSEDNTSTPESVRKEKNIYRKVVKKYNS